MTDLASTLRALPTVLLHDHLDGGLRPETVVELCAGAGHALPTRDPAELGAWFHDAASSGSLERYLETFEHTVAAMQTVEGLRRVAHEAVLDLAADGVVLAELRYAPEQHQRAGLSLTAVVEAVQEGFASGVAAAGAQGHRIRVGTLLSAMRQGGRSREVAALAVAHRDAGVVGFDIAGPEAGFPATDHREAFDLLRDALVPVTVHAGEGDGPASVRGALSVGALRLGHGVRVVEDVAPDGTAGRVAAWVRDRRVPLEVCPSSNLQTGIAGSVAEHPVTRLRDLGFAVTVGTDNRLQSRTSLSREMALLVDEAGWTLADLWAATLRAADAAFLPLDGRTRLVEDVLRPAWTAELDRSTHEHA
ncbi:adenosine deaminase [Cellulomonas endophytica]|uniref:adenosine deaminase n=1 Tax=Cellulomonas endophytica TaxID=2494735 RepID=UPI0010121F0E|nr:adenosine deaminase [Cellulomonas endophytica]